MENAFALAHKLASVFSSTGLWPVIWAWPQQEPDAYMRGSGSPSRADSLNAAQVLRRSWQSGMGPPARFPGLAAAAGASRLSVDPFGSSLAKSSMALPPPGGWVVMLVPVNRPADVYSVLGPELTEYFSDDEITAVVRSWEERFGAVVAVMTPSTLELAVGAPPRDDSQARRLAAEHTALMPDADPEDLQGLVPALRSTRGTRGVTSARYWSLGWPD